MRAIFDKQKLDQTRTLIQGAEQVVITTHRSPDGDAIGSSLALHHYLVRKGKESVVLVPDDYPEFLHWLPGHAEVLVYDANKAEARELLDKANLIFSLDYNTLSRTGDLATELEARTDKDFILVDHHQQPGDYASVVFSDTEACSTAELVYDLITALGDEHLIDATLGTCIYTGIMTDSGSFRFPSVTPHTHMIAAQLIQVGVDHSLIHRKVYDNNLLDRLQLVGYALSRKLEMLEDCPVAYIALSREELSTYNYQPGDTEGLVNYALSIKGVAMAAFIREGSNTVKLSFRSKGSFDVNKFARQHFNGGGHMNAAGGAMDAPFATVVEAFVKAAKAHCHEMDAS